MLWNAKIATLCWLQYIHLKCTSNTCKASRSKSTDLAAERAWTPQRPVAWLHCSSSNSLRYDDTLSRAMTAAGKKKMMTTAQAGIYIDIRAENVTHACGISHWTQSRLTRATVSEDQLFTWKRNNSATATWLQATPSESSYTSCRWDSDSSGLKSLHKLHW